MKSNRRALFQQGASIAGPAPAAPLTGAQGSHVEDPEAVPADPARLSPPLPTTRNGNMLYKTLGGTGIDSMAILDQAFEAIRTFQPLNHDEMTALLDRTKTAAAQGEFELFKTSARFDSTAQHPEWFGTPAKSA